MTDYFTLVPSNDVNSLRRITIGHAGIPLTEVFQVLGIEEPAQPHKVTGGQVVMRNDSDLNARHALRDFQRRDRRNLLRHSVLG